jgi:RNA 2',3'-cyclic 3'-phosphodiesterase
MDAGDPKPKAVRLFAALDLPDDVRDGLDAWGAHELADPALRPVPVANLHMTLCFLGWTPPDRVEEATAILAATKARRVRMRLRPEPVAKPPRQPSLYAIEAESPAAAELADEVATAFCEAGLAEREERPFWPHVTVARVRAEGRGESRRRRRPQRVERPPGPLPGEQGGEFCAVRLCLYRSTMRRDGSQYVPISQIELEVT